MVRIILIVSLFICCNRIQMSSVNCENITKFIQMEVNVVEHTRMGDEVIFNVKYYNITDSIIEFYPLGFVSICKSDMVFGENQTLSINQIMDYREIIKILPKQTYIYHYKTKIVPPFFNKGVNKLHVYYRIKAYKDTKNTICGSISSNEFFINIK